jgi:2-amino-4-hydroxy-6-hydroxymethyldihydropteridine diphosphokinase
MAILYLSTGSNLGDRLDNLVVAARKISQQVGRILNISPVVESQPWGFKADTSFLNQVLMIETEFVPGQVLEKVLEIEKSLGRERTGQGYTSRSIDIDILLYNDELINNDNLVVPHPLMQNRKFVLFPLAAIAPGLFHPGFQVPIIELLQKLDDNSPISEVVDAEEFVQLMKN